MTPNNTQQGDNLAARQAQCEAIQKKILEIREVMESDIQKLTIVIAGKNGIAAVNKVFTFAATTGIPPEFSQFLDNYSDRLAAEILSINANVPIIQMGSHIVSLHTFIKDYTAGDEPSIDTGDVEALHKLPVGGSVTILLNGEMQVIKRIS